MLKLPQSMALKKQSCWRTFIFGVRKMKQTELTSEMEKYGLIILQKHFKNYSHI